MKRIALVIMGLLLVVLAAGAVYYFQLTAPVEVSNQPPSAPTLAAASNPNSAPTATPPGVSLEETPSTPETGSATSATATSEKVPTATAVAQTPAPAPAARVYRIDPAQSQASYTVDETFFDTRGLVTAVGTTNAVAGDIYIDRANPAASRVGEIVVDISQLRTDEPNRDNAIRREWLESATYPLATLKNSTLSSLPASWPEGQPFKFQLTGDMTVRDVTRPVTWDVEAQIDGDTLRGKASAQVKMTEFGFSPPSLSILRVEDEVKLGLDFVAMAVGTP